jgi:hypothetical protein
VTVFVAVPLITTVLVTPGLAAKVDQTAITIRTHSVILKIQSLRNTSELHPVLSSPCEYSRICSVRARHGVFYRLDAHTYPADERIIRKWIEEPPESADRGTGPESNVNDLLEKLHLRMVPLSQCFVEALQIALNPAVLENPDLATLGTVHAPYGPLGFVKSGESCMTRETAHSAGSCFAR